MKKSVYVHFSLSALLVVSMLSPTAVLARGDGKKFFKEGMKAEVAEQWDTAVEQFALAVADNPKNPEYRLHYQRAIFNASQMYMRKGTAQANEKDYVGAYTFFRRAYAYDPTNELAKAEMERMLRLQKGLSGDEMEEKRDSKGNVTLVKTGLNSNAAAQQDVQVPQKIEKLTNVPFPSGVDLQFIIKELAKDLDLNVLFDSESFRGGADRKIRIELKNVTAAKALDYIFLQEGLFFQKVGPRTILVANGNRRQNFQQLVLRTFYLANADPKDVQKVLQGAIPAQPGRTPTISIVDEDTNSITIRDTEENIRLMGRLITSLDKDRAEVVMDVAIYEVSKSDLLKLGNQIGTEAGLTNLAGTTSTALGNNEFRPAGATAGSVISRAFGIGVVLPAINLVAFQNRQNTKLLASTQIHAFNNEDSSARIGQRVPVRTATISNGISNPGTGGSNNGGFLSDVINYEQVGLDLKFKPIVFPNQDVQVAMEITSKDVAACNTPSGNPCFSERVIKGTARVQNNKTLLLASVAQDRQSDGRQGLPLLGLIPIIGRLFTAPTKDNNQVDIVIAITPRVIRAPSILPEDEIERPTGSVAVPTSGSLEAMIIQEEREELLAAARRLPTVAQVQLPDQKVDDAPVYVKSNGEAHTISQNQAATAQPKTETTQQANSAAPNTALPLSSLRPIDASVKTLDIVKTSNNVGAENPAEDTQQIYLQPVAEKADKTISNNVDAPRANAPTADIQLLTNLPEMKVGEKTKIAVIVKSATAFRSAVLGLRFDDKKIAVRSVAFGDVFGGGVANTSISPFLNQNGKMFVSLSSAKDSAQNASGVLAFIEVECLSEGKHEVTFDKDVLNMLTADGKNFAVKF
ncbi:MAG TPA: secretin N-terminal domain-containing protein [Pyrinomonadaceae bacterium]